MKYRKKCIDAKGRYCHRCGSRDKIQVHHIDGDDENDELSNLVPLCEPCHVKVHADRSRAAWPPATWREFEVQLSEAQYATLREHISKKEGQIAIQSLVEGLLSDAISDLEDSPDTTASWEKSKLEQHERILVDVVNELGNAKISEIEDEYTARIDEQPSRKTIRRYLLQLEREDIVIIRGKTSDRTYEIR